MSRHYLRQICKESNSSVVRALRRKMLALVLLSFIYPVCYSFIDIPVRLPDLPSIPAQVINGLFQNRCITDLGCFYTGPPFYDPLNRPISLAPTNEMLTRFLLYTPSNPSEEYQLKPTLSSLDNSSFNSALPTKVLIHGYRSDLELEDIRFQMKDALLNQSNYNVIIVDWTEHNGPPYPQAVSNARAVGAHVAKLLQFLMDNRGINSQSIHIIGHSLGGQMSGWIGERIPHIGRITGLDPAGPYFHNAENAVRLDTTDADFVDIIHSDGGDNVVEGLGLGEPIGHVDFYPNGGRRQPGCTYTSNRNIVTGAVINATTQFLVSTCDHSRANNYFLESIRRTDCRFLSVKCESYSTYEKGTCPPENSTVAEMGFFSRKPPNLEETNKFYLRTNGDDPFCLEDSIRL